MAFGIVFKVAQGEDPAEVIAIVNHNIDGDRFGNREIYDYQNATDEADMKTKAAAIQADWADNFEVRYVKKNA